MPVKPFAETTETDVTVPALEFVAESVPPLKDSQLPTVITSGFPVDAVLLPSNVLVDICWNLASVTALLAIVVA